MWTVLCVLLGAFLLPVGADVFSHSFFVKLQDFEQIIQDQKQVIQQQSDLTNITKILADSPISVQLEEQAKTTENLTEELRDLKKVVADQAVLIADQAAVLRAQGDRITNLTAALADSDGRIRNVSLWCHVALRNVTRDVEDAMNATRRGVQRDVNETRRDVNALRTTLDEAVKELRREIEALREDPDDTTDHSGDTTDDATAGPVNWGNWDGFHALLGDSGLGNTELQLHDSVVVQPGDTVLFNIVTINLMGGFDPWSGVFTAQQNGTYFLRFDVVNAFENLELRLERGSDQTHDPYDYHQGAEVLCSKMTECVVYQYLHVGDQVFCTVHDMAPGPVHLSIKSENTFEGYLIAHT